MAAPAAAVSPAADDPVAGRRRAEVIDELDRDGLLPAITFIFSRVGCEAAVGQLLAAGTRLIPEREGLRIRRHVEERVESLADEDLSVLGYFDFVEGLSRGFAAHHAGMLPLFREIVEELFTAARIRAVFATETLALGINMPARTVVLEKLVKFNGEAHVDITPAEYTQLTGRAGRRGIDVEGHAVVQWARGVDPLAVGGLASTRTYPLRSSFRPTYNMAVNLVAQVGREVAREILETSFAQFQADRAVVGIATAVRRNEEGMEGYAEAMHCHLGDFREYAALRRSLADAEKEGVKSRSASRRAEAAVSLEALRIGDVIRIPAGRRAGWAVVVQPARTGKGAPTGPGGRHRGQAVPPAHPRRRARAGRGASTHVKVPPHFNPKSPKSRRDLATSLRIAVPHGFEDSPRRRAREVTAGESERVAAAAPRAKAHPCHQCPDRETHARWAERWWRLKRETVGLQRKVEGRTNTVARTFDRICDALEALRLPRRRRHGRHRARGAAAPALHREGPARRRVPAPRRVEAARRRRPGRRGVGAGARAAPRGGRGLAADAQRRGRRGADPDGRGSGPRSRTSRPSTTCPRPRCPTAGMAWMVHRWASGERLDTVLRGQEMAAGDFVRRCKQIVDLLDQVAKAATDGELRRTARTRGGCRAARCRRRRPPRLRSGQ